MLMLQPVEVNFSWSEGLDDILTLTGEQAVKSKSITKYFI